MAENEETEDQQTDSTETEETETATETETDPAAELEKWKSLARKNEEQAKKNASAAQKLKELEDAQKSEVDKLKDRIAELEPKTKEAARLRVALRKGLSESQAKRLMGDTEEELEQDADELLATFAPAQGDEDEPSGPSRRPQERLKPGATPSAEPEPSPNELADAVMQRQRGY